MYAYVRNNPLTLFDLYGLETTSISWNDTPEAFFGSGSSSSSSDSASREGQFSSTDNSWIGISQREDKTWIHKQDDPPSTSLPGDCFQDPWTGPRVNFEFPNFDSCHIDSSLTDQITIAIILFGTNIISSSCEFGSGVWGVIKGFCAQAYSKGAAIAGSVATGIQRGCQNTTKAIDGVKTGWCLLAQGGAQINGLVYTEHALERMAPRGLIQKGIDIISRGVPPSVVENAINFGAKVKGNTPNEIVHVFENVRVVTDVNSTRVITVITTGN